jgi:hypothetical protein
VSILDRELPASDRKRDAAVSAGHMDVESRAVMHLLVIFGGMIAVGEEGVRDYEGRQPNSR